MWHLITAPVLLPMLTAILIMLPPVHRSPVYRRWLSIISGAVQLVLTVCLLMQVQQQGALHYAIGNWQAPFGIILVADLLSVLLVCLTNFLALGAICYSGSGEDEKGSFFHPLLHFQLMGINGAFLTGDLFNLFVFFEILLIASYALLIHAGGKSKTKAAIHYVVLNLTGSAIFLLALAVLYGTLGTLNIADMALKVTMLPATDLQLVKAGGLMLMIVFALKAAVLPLQFWLPATYASAPAPVAALFAIMTKIGVYALLRVYVTIFGEQAGPLANLGASLLLPAGLATIVLGAVGVMASQDFRKLVANLVLVSVGTLVALVAVPGQQAAAAALYYTLHSTLITVALFLLADLVSSQRGQAADRLVAGRRVGQPLLLGGCFMLAAMTVAGLPPFSGFIGKIMLLQAVADPGIRPWFWSLLLVSSLFVIIALARAGSMLFWRVNSKESGTERAAPLQVFAVFWLLAASPLLVIFGGPLTALVSEAASSLYDHHATIERLLSPDGAAP